MYATANVYPGPASARGGGLLLDQYPGAEVAFSFRRLREGYTGPCMLIQRQLGSPSQLLIDFTEDGVADIDAITAFADGSGEVFIVDWYDQSTNARHATALVGDAPRLQLSSPVGIVMTNGKLACAGSNSGTWYMSVPDFNPSSRALFYAASVAAPAQANSGDAVFGQYRIGDNQRSFMGQFSSGGTIRINASQNGTDAIELLSSQTYTARQYIIEFGFNGGLPDATRYAAWLNNTTLTMSVSGTPVNVTELFNATSPFTLMAYDTGTNPLNGTFQEVIYYAADMANARSAIAANMNAYYGIY